MLVLEAIVTVFAALLLYIIVGMETACSVVIGGAAFIVPNAWFAKYVFRHSAADSASIAVRWFYVGEVIKIIATVLIFTLGFLLFNQLDVAALFLAYITLLIINLWGNSILMSH